MFGMRLCNKKIRIILGAAIFLAALFLSANVNVVSARADDILGQQQVFWVDSDYDRFARTRAAADLVHISSKAYFYVDDRYWSGLSPMQRGDLTNKIYDLADAFDNIIYPKETEFWGSEPNPGIDGDPKITIFFEQLISGNGGYFDTLNGYDVNGSNKREMFFISVDAVNNIENAKMFLAHEFQHLISFNQKDILRKIAEEVWLNELRSEYSISLVGFNEPYNDSGLARRADLFLNQPSDSLTEWPNVSLDYAQAALFGEYLVEQYGPDILTETLRSSDAGINSINRFLENHNYKERFTDIFGNWAIANYLNNISQNLRYGYSLSGLQNLKISPSSVTNLLSQSSYNFYYSLKPWQPSWYKFIVDQMAMLSKAVKIDFAAGALFRIFYADNLGRTGILANSAYIDDPGGLSDFVIIPVNQSKVSDFGKNDSPAAISFTLNFVDAAPGRGLSALKDGLLIKKSNEKELYVIEGKYKRYLNSGVIALYGQLDSSKAIEVDEDSFHSYITANYVREVNDKKVYAVWPDGTKHWLNITPQQWDASGRDWNSIFIINESELNSYKTEADIVR